MSTVSTKVVILIRRPNQWVEYARKDSIEEAEKYWSDRIAGKGITPWTSFATPEEAEKMLKDPSYENQSKFFPAA